ncbi:DUF4391 domain-containing protein [Desulfosporosinus sp. FKA]|uniref:DUF4391 domain-containing protein n=1 Tax=Desulfosporosinus sp. FKA TaxID=1969834 RepID=UPI000B4A4DC8|nr:DUF4391 domain-containing protein [Desulfosporosinus sp. FKA]
MELYKKLNIPIDCKIDKTIFKKLFYENASLSSSDKELFTDVIDKVTWQYCLNLEKLNVPSYKDDEREYLEIEIIEVALLAEKSLRRIAEIIMRTIPYPMLLFFRYDKKYQIWVAHQKFSLADSSKITLEEFTQTDWIDESSTLWDNLNLKNMRHSNYFAMYSDMVDAIYVFNAKRLAGQDKEISGQEAKELLEQIAVIDSQIASMRASLKKETLFNRKMEFNIRIKNLEKKKQEMIGNN